MTKRSIEPFSYTKSASEMAGPWGDGRGYGPRSETGGGAGRSSRAQAPRQMMIAIAVTVRSSRKTISPGKVGFLITRGRGVEELEQELLQDAPNGFRIPLVLSSREGEFAILK